MSVFNLKGWRLLLLWAAVTVFSFSYAIYARGDDFFVYIAAAYALLIIYTIACLGQLRKIYNGFINSSNFLKVVVVLSVIYFIGVYFVVDNIVSNVKEDPLPGAILSRFLILASIVAWLTVVSAVSLVRGIVSKNLMTIILSLVILLLMIFVIWSFIGGKF